MKFFIIWLLLPWVLSGIVAYLITSIYIITYIDSKHINKLSYKHLLLFIVCGHLILFAIIVIFIFDLIFKSSSILKKFAERFAEK